VDLLHKEITGKDIVSKNPKFFGKESFVLKNMFEHATSSFTVAVATSFCEACFSIKKRLFGEKELF